MESGKFSVYIGISGRSAILASRLTHLCLRVTLEIVVRIFDTSDNNLGIKNDFTKYFKKSC